MSDTKTMRIPGEWRIPYNYTIGDFATSFFEALREKRILGCVCDTCGRVSVPPKSFCEFCFIPVTKLVEIGGDGTNGTIEAITVVTAPFAGSPPVPYAVAFVRLEGATSSIANYIRGVDLPTDVQQLPDAIQVGAPVHVVFGDDLDGRVTDFWFEAGNA
ncbi:MAG: protein associated with acetyl-CoA C-acyltransferase [Aeromicrobium sp.]|nr:protein associated with acetyl-CoA C-acyltransferase [Aeromicrobium sp.]